MSNEIVVADSRELSQQDVKRDLALTSEDINRVVGHLEKVKEAVSKCLNEGIDKDFAVIPGTGKKDKDGKEEGKRALLKPGAEKLMKLFGLGVRFKLTEKEFDRVENFAMFSYEAEVYHLKSGVVLSTCEGASNSWEKKYKEKALWRGGIKVGMEPVPVCDILNTLKKMAQKRAMIGAVIIATGASDYFSQDEDEVAEMQPVKEPVKTADASRFVKQESNNDLSGYKITFGKFNGKTLGEVGKDDVGGYVDYLTKNNPSPEGKLKEFIDTAREFLRAA